MIGILHNLRGREKSHEIRTIDMPSGGEDKNIGRTHSGKVRSTDLIEIRPQLTVQDVPGPEDRLRASDIRCAAMSEIPTGTRLDMFKAQIWNTGNLRGLDLLLGRLNQLAQLGDHPAVRGIVTIKHHVLPPFPFSNRANI